MDPQAADAVLLPTESHVEHALLRGFSSAWRFGELVDRLAGRLLPRVQFASHAATRLVVAEALGSLDPTGARFPEEPMARTALAHALDATLGRLRRAGAEPFHLRAVGSGQADLMADLLEVVDSRLRERALVDGERKVGFVARALSEGAGDAALFEELAGGDVLVSGMAAFEPDELAFLEALHGRLRARGQPGVRIELLRIEGPVASTIVASGSTTADELERRWGSLNDPPEIEWRVAEKGVPVAVIGARTADGEARAVATHVVAALARGTPPERIAIVVPDLDESRLAPLRNALEDARVPFCEPCGRKAALSPEGRIALSLLALAKGPVTRELVVDILRAPCLSPEAWLEGPKGPHKALRATLLAHRLGDVPVEVDRNGNLLVDQLAQVVRERPEEAWMPQALERLLNETRWLGENMVDERGLAAPPTRREMARRFLLLMDRLQIGVPDPAELRSAFRADFRPSGGLLSRALGQSAAAARALREAVRGLVEGACLVGLADAPSSPAVFAAELEHALQAFGLGLGASGTGARACAVRIARVPDLAGQSHDLLFVTGLDEGAYSGVDEEGSLLDERIQRRLPPLFRPRSARERETVRHTELAWAMASADRVVLSRRGGDTGDAAPHRLIHWGLTLVEREHREPASRVALAASCPDPRSSELSALAAGAPVRGELGDRVLIERARTEFFLDPRAPAGAHTGKIQLEHEAAQKQLASLVGGDSPESAVAVTVIERAAGCAFAGFARRVLRIRKVDDVSEPPDARERGNLIHRALHAAFDSLKEPGAGTDRNRLLERARVAAEARLGLAEPMAPLRREAVLQAVADAVHVVARALDAGEGMHFELAEKSFGAGAAPPWGPLELVGEEGPSVFVDGQIDRIDRSTDGLRAMVIDYKTGRAPAADDHGKTAFQLPLYAAVVARALLVEDVEAAYIAVRPRGVVEEWPKASEARKTLGASRTEAQREARRVILSLWQGEAAPRPIKAALCSRCDARDVCRRPAVAPLEEEDS